MKNFKKGFTLVEMLIVVVIIGILSAALLPRLQGAQSAARDSARKSDLSQLGSAILSYYNNRGEYPWTGSNTSGDTKNRMIPADNIRDILMQVVELSSLPTDPNRSNYISFAKEGNEAQATGNYFKENNTIEDGQYGYARMKKNTIKNGGYLLMARTETEGGSNFLSTIGVDEDLKNFKLCNGFEIVKEGEESTSATGGICKYSNKGQLRYVYVF